jgi:hypothetical protein
MTFYNIIYGILFLGAFQILVNSFNTFDLKVAALSFILSIIIINDIFYTSHLIETRRKRYRPSMKLLDLVGFLVLSVSFFLLNPSSNIFTSAVSQSGFHRAILLSDFINCYNQEPFFWCLIFIYSILAIIWNNRAGIEKQSLLSQLWELPPFKCSIIMFTSSLLSTNYELVTIIRIIVIVYMLYYFFFKKLRNYEKEDNKIYYRFRGLKIYKNPKI